MQDFEKLGVFYLGRECDVSGKEAKDSLLLYDSKDLTTHAVCVGMTGSGKTGLCIGLLEEAAIDGIPAIVVDPKGDLSNLLLTFPDLKAEDFRPWINEEEARNKNLSAEEYAARQAELWSTGLGAWGQDGARIRRLKESAEFTVYTPGSSAGIPVSILKSFEAPEAAVREDGDLLRERINTTVTSLLNLLGIEADPVNSREHILLSTILDRSWREGLALDLGGLIQAVQSPPVDRVGVFELESFFPSKERFDLAMRLNNLLASPGFSAWLEGEPLDIRRILYTDRGKPRVSIFSIAHLGDAERMFFVSLLLTQLLGWVRTQSGTGSLRAVFYMDEIFGYMPPVADPPSKAPLLTLLKQARAFGLGVVLATQNPVDLDYKGLSNTGTWFIGRLQTERDQARVLDGLEGAASSAGGRFDRNRMQEILAGLGKRVFLMNNVHEDGPVIFQTRWVLSYLRGPLTRDQIKKLMQGRGAALPSPVRESVRPARRASAAGGGEARPMLAPGIPEFFLPPVQPAPAGASLFYEPVLLAMAKVYYADAKAGVAAEREVVRLAQLPARAARVDWDEAAEERFAEEDLETDPREEAAFGSLPKAAGTKKNYAAWAREFKDWVYHHETLELLRSPALGMVSRPGESESDFRIRLQLAAREKRDLLVAKLRKQYADKAARLEERLRKAEQAVEREKAESKQQKLQTVISLGATLLGALLGRKRMSRSTLGRGTTAMRGAGRIFKQGKDVEHARENLEELRREAAQLTARLEQEIAGIQGSLDPLTEALESHRMKPRKKDIAVFLTALAWAPYRQDPKGGLVPAW